MWECVDGWMKGQAILQVTVKQEEDASSRLLPRRVFDHATPITHLRLMLHYLPELSEIYIDDLTSTDTTMSSTKPILPAPYFYFFFLVEPILTLAGAAYAIFLPETYGRELLPRAVEIGTDAVGGSTRGRLIIGCLGNCTLYTPVHQITLCSSGCM
jgi:hypothetical protein